MAKLFYDHLTIVDEVAIVFTEHGISPEEQKELLSHLDAMLQYEIVDLILTHLPEEHHEAFLTRLKHAPHDKSTMHFIKEHIPVDIEGEIVKRANSVKKRVLSALKNNK